MQLKTRPGTALTFPGTPSDKRALKFYIEKTAPTMTAHTEFTKTFWQIIVPQLATSEVAIRHLTIALASRHERQLDTAGPDVHRFSLQKTERENFVSSLSSLTHGSAVGDVEVLLVACVMFLAYGALTEVEQQTAQELEHYSSGLKIVIERAQDTGQPQRSSEIIDMWVRPILVRLELIYSLFMPPRSPTGYVVVVEPRKPALPPQFPSILAARQSFHEICCWRHHKSLRSADWTYHSAAFRSIRRLMLDWYHLVIKYKSHPECKSDLEQQRIAILLSQFQVMFVSLIYSARTDLHSFEDHLRPTVVELPKRDQLILQYELPERYLQQSTGLDWESRDHPDPLQVHLLPLLKVTDIREASASLSATYYV